MSEKTLGQNLIEASNEAIDYHESRKKLPFVVNHFCETKYCESIWIARFETHDEAKINEIQPWRCDLCIRAKALLEKK